MLLLFRPILILTMLAGAALVAAEPLSFNRDIRPILSENCFQCHGPEKNTREAELRLDRREDALDAKAFVPGKPDESELVRRVFDEDPNERMPSPKSNRTLTEAQKQLLKRWVTEGAEYEPHWAYVVPRRPAVPAISNRSSSSNQSSVVSDQSQASSLITPPLITDYSERSPIDAFIAATLARERLSPAPEADRRTLIRRLSLDLLGLPPEPADVEAFAASRDPSAYQQLVKKYLASPHFGERLAIHWLDLVRFADTIGFHNDVEIKTWPYRDYVINAFNRNLPFDQFTREQLAGDLLPGSTITQRVASGYNRLHRISGEGGIQDKEYFAKYSADRVRTTATVWLGSTLACAECHDHKFDPFTAKDFYRFAAIFSDLKEKGAYNLSGGFTRENLTEEPIFATPAQQQRAESLDAEIKKLAADMKAVTDEQLAASRAEWETATLSLGEAGKLAWQSVTPLHAESLAQTPLTIEDDKSVLAGGKNPKHETYVITIPATQDNITAVRVEAVADDRFPGDGVARSGSTFFLSEIDVVGIGGTTSASSVAGTEARPSEKLRIAAVRSSGATEPGYPAAAVSDGDPATSLSFVRKRGGGIALQFAEPWSGGPESRLVIRIHSSERHPYQHLGRFRLSLHTLPEPDANPDSVPDNVLKALKVAAEKRSAAQKREVAAYYRTVAPELAALRAQHTAAVNARDYLIESLPSMPVSKSVEPRPIRVLPRGNWMDDSGEAVEPGVPGFLRQITPADGKRVSRLDFAEWLVAPDNPLVARTFVNRLWRVYFGAGLVRTLEDLGSQGEWPSHPELLDWLAVEFRESGWNVKHMVELLVMSRTYRQSSAGSTEAEERDPTNRFLARQNRIRLDAELVRDNALAISGLLVRTIGGPSAKPYQPEGYYAPLNFPRREYVPDIGDGLWRRGVYTHWQRTFLLPSFMAFDAPARDECTANRMPSNTPLQALTLLNDPSYVEAARIFAEKILREGGKAPRARIGWAFARALARPPSAEESNLLQGLFEKQLARYRADEPAARELVATGEKPTPSDLPSAELAAWTSVSRAILNLHETITRN